MKAALTTIVLALLAGVVLLGWNYHHEHTLSPEVRAALTAILPEVPPIRVTCENWPECTALGHPFVYSTEGGKDNDAYLRAAHLAVRTKQDPLVVTELDTAFGLWDGNGNQIEQGCQMLKQVRKDAGLKPYPLDPCGDAKTRPLVPAITK